ncbi:MAG: carboxylesterase/lipase family protein [Myxococcota bacterium]
MLRCGPRRASELGPVVETSTGRVEGVERDGLSVFLGIPYARPPLGDRRWRAPETPEPWSGVRPARQFAAAAPQSPGMLARMLGVAETPASEDCLYLNVWTPALDSARRPTLVWLHGGSFTSGSSAWPVFNGSALARRGDVVVVTLNYRLGALGFLPVHPPGAEPGTGLGNFGLLDQIAALRWVRANAAAFGGDPRNVTLFGESAGAMSAATLLGIPAARGLFQRAILQSGAAHHVHDRETGERIAQTFARQLELAPGDTERLWDLPVEALLEAQRRTAAAVAHDVRGLPFQPVVDGALLPRPPIEAIGDGAAPALPLLVGTNRDEWTIYGLADPKAQKLDESALLRRCERSLGVGDGSGRDRARRLLETYRAAREGRASVEPRALWFAIQTDRWFRHPAMRLAELHAQRQEQTYAYLFTWESPALGGALGACHALEIPFVFGCTEAEALAPIVGNGPAAASLSGRMQDAWLAFARSGDPSHPDGDGWPGYEATRRATMVLGEPGGVEDAPLEAERSIWDEIG